MATFAVGDRVKVDCSVHSLHGVEADVVDVLPNTRGPGNPTVVVRLARSVGVYRAGQRVRFSASSLRLG
jgi:hypothetical protein